MRLAMRMRLCMHHHPTSAGGTLNMSIGWASAHFGILLVEKQTVSDPTLNVIGFFFAVTSIIFYAQVFVLSLM